MIVFLSAFDSRQISGKFVIVSQVVKCLTSLGFRFKSKEEDMFEVILDSEIPACS